MTATSKIAGIVFATGAFGTIFFILCSMDSIAKYGIDSIFNISDFGLSLIDTSVALMVMGIGMKYFLVPHDN